MCVCYNQLLAIQIYMECFDYHFQSMKLLEKSLCSMTPVVVLFTYQIKLNVSTSKRACIVADAFVFQVKSVNFATTSIIISRDILINLLGKRPD